MKNKALDIQTYHYKNSENFLIDANIWLYISAPPSAKLRGETTQYSAVLKDLLKSKANLYISSTILSEYLNRYIRIEFNAHHKKKYANFKEFRKSADFLAVGAKAAGEAKDIAKICVTKDDNFSSCTISDVLGDFESGTNDFNDGVILHFCRTHDCKLITHDGDFIAGGIDVLTGNKKLLAECPSN
ncbi:type II toxin-antitoxin system VapC family toxin [Burkholderia gladioli]|uniref:type II toxin-antitoxin system VapC family toxin n=1 Tax=Burkholderia gladioli TaxID=28095 RepID=UPI0016401D37|nr:PIN domain-containing protein [Burkholderia gladioli]